MSEAAAGSQAMTEETDEQRKSREREEGYRLAIPAKESLHQALVAAGVTGQAPFIDDDDPAGRITLPPLSAEGVTLIASLMREAMERDFTVADRLRDAFDHHGMTISGIRLVRRRLVLGKMPVADADHLAVLLGAPNLHDGDRDDTDFDHWPTAQNVIARLTDAVKKTTGYDLDTDFHPQCHRCRIQATVRLGDIDIDTADTLAALLTPETER